MTGKKRARKDQGSAAAAGGLGGGGGAATAGATDAAAASSKRAATSEAKRARASAVAAVMAAASDDSSVEGQFEEVRVGGSCDVWGGRRGDVLWLSNVASGLGCPLALDDPAHADHLYLTVALNHSCTHPPTQSSVRAAAARLVRGCVCLCRAFA